MPEGKTRGAVQRELRQKEEARKALRRKYAQVRAASMRGAREERKRAHQVPRSELELPHSQQQAYRNVLECHGRFG